MSTATYYSCGASENLGRSALVTSSGFYYSICLLVIMVASADVKITLDC